MPAKNIIMQYPESGIALYCLIRQETSGFLFDNSDGDFRPTPVDLFLPLTEHTVIKGMYEVSENRRIWTDGRYVVVCYKQIGAAPTIANDVLIGTGDMYVVDNAEVVLNADVAAARQTILQRRDEAVGSAVVAFKGIEHVYSVDMQASGRVVSWRIVDKAGVEVVPMSTVGVIELGGGTYGVPITISTIQAAYIEFWNQTDNVRLLQPVTVVDMEQLINTSLYGELSSVPVAGAHMTLSDMLSSLFQYFLRTRAVRNTGEGTAVETMRRADGSVLAAANVSDDGTVFLKDNMQS